MKAGENRGQRGRQVDQNNQLTAIELEDIADFEDLSRGEANALDRVEDHGYSPRKRHEHDLGRFIEAKPDRDQRYPRQQRDLLEAIEPGRENPVEDRR